ncbi:SPO14 [Sanghuangporus weigelae]
MASLADVVDRAANTHKPDKQQEPNGDVKKPNGNAGAGNDGEGGSNTNTDSQPVKSSSTEEAGAAAESGAALPNGHGSAHASPLLAATAFTSPERRRRGGGGVNGAGDSVDMPHASSTTPSQNQSRRTSVDSTASPVITRSPHDSPSARTGPPRSFSYNFARSPNLSRQNTRAHDEDIAEEFPDELGDEFNLDGDVGNNTINTNGKSIPVSGSGTGSAAAAPLPTAVSRLRSQFRGALDYNDPEQREREREARERREKNRLSKIADSDVWINPRKWLSSEHNTQDSPTNEGEGRASYFDFLKPGEKGKEKEVVNEKPDGAPPAETPEGEQLEKPQGPKGLFTRSSSHDQVPSSEKLKVSGRRMERSHSMPHMKRSESRKASIAKGAPRWSRLRSLLPTLAQQGRNEADPDAKRGQMAVQQNVVNITDELITGGLAVLMLKLWFERDERGARRVPILFHRLRVRISDSLHPLSANKAVFRVECEYVNGAARWVVYRTLRDFVSLHTHYRLSNAFNHNVDALPEFPRTSLPYFKFLREKGKENDREVRKQDFAVMQRDTLENYLIGLVRAVMFHPTSNRLAGFLEISALSIHLAQSGGWQAKAGMLTIQPASKKSIGFGRKNASWSSRKKQRWCCLRESYCVALEEPGELEIWDVFLLDSDFKIERPKRYYRQILQPNTDKFEERSQHGDDDGHSTLGRVKAKVEKALHFRVGGRHMRSHSGTGRHSTTVASIDRRHARSHSHGSSSRSRRSQSRTTTSGESSGSESESEDEGPQLVDPSTNVEPMREGRKHEDRQEGEGHLPDMEKTEKQGQKKSKSKKRTKDVSRHTFYVTNSQMRVKVFAKNERQMQQWITAFEKVANSSHWTGRNRFDSFAPIRLNVAAQWLVDGRDYMWNLSRAILLARERIYIHDWWLSPELQMRRPLKERYRLDRLLEQKAKEGVKIYIILYQEVSNRTTPTDSNYTKQRLASLHKDIMVQRSPSHFQTGTFYWAHHEKLCVIDEAIAFMGGIDLCFGRWDTPQHVLVDIPDAEGGSEDSTQIWPGKDYSNARISDFFTLNKPYEDMYDRHKIPRMPWHDVGVQIVGQPARDLCRHFVQRWNYLLRIKNHSRAMPFLLPPPDFKLQDLEEQGLTGTCEIQICRSCGPWSMGTPTKVEHSIQNAYLKAIQLSEHFVYIENQFFITSTVVNDTPVENKIGDALVHRIIRAHREGRTWKACIMIPLLPGFPYSVDHSDASSVRIILECQNRTICRGPHSIFSRLRKEGIDPDEYISVFSLRNWGKLPGNVLTSEMVYIHGKVCIVDDRLAIIGSANINERSQRGDRDSELAVIVRDTDMIDGKMAGQPFKVGRFAHTLRVRLMREHLGVDVDAMYEEDLMAINSDKDAEDQEPWDPDREQQQGDEDVTRTGKVHYRTAMNEAVGEFKDSAEQALLGSELGAVRDAGYYLRKAGIKSSGANVTVDEKYLDEERQDFSQDGRKEPGFASAIVPTLEEKTIMEHRPPADQSKGKEPILDAVDHHQENGVPPEARVHGDSGELYGAPADASRSPQTDDEVPHARGRKGEATEEEKATVHARRTIRRHLSATFGGNAWTLPTPAPEVDPHGFEDPVCDEFWKDVWVASAVHNTEIFRKVFHCIPDDTVTTWKQYKEFVLHHERLNKPVKGSSEPLGRVPSETGDEDAPGHEKESEAKMSEDTLKAKSSVRTSGSSSGTQNRPHSPSNANVGGADIKRTPSRIDEPFEKWERDEMEKLLGQLCGHLVVYPTRFLEGEDAANNFLFNADRLLPMPIYD